MKSLPPEAGMSLVEVMVCVSMSFIVLGALFVSSITIQKSIHASEVFASTYSDQRRIIDYLGRDLRRSVSISATDSTGAPCPIGTAPLTISGPVTIVLTLPGYYQSNVPNAADYPKALPVVRSGDTVDYGNDATFAPPIQIVFRKAFVAAENCVCYVREEAGKDEVIVRAAQNLFAQVLVSADGSQATVTASFYGPYSAAGPLISTFDDLLLRNSPIGCRP